MKTLYYHYIEMAKESVIHLIRLTFCPSFYNGQYIMVDQIRNRSKSVTWNSNHKGLNPQELRSLVISKQVNGAYFLNSQYGLYVNTTIVGYVSSWVVTK